MSWAKVTWEISLPILAERGYLIPAIDTESVDYLSCAIQLARSIRQWHPDANISVISVKRCSDPVFDHVVPLPFGDQAGFANDWQCFSASPYRQTIKLEADMLVTSPIDHWWTLFENRDIVISQGCRDFYDRPARSRYYRQLIDENQLPDVYNAITYWRVSKTSQEFWNHVRNIFENWDAYRVLLKFPDEKPSTDVVYAMVAEIMGRENVTLPPGMGPSITHMKRYIIPTRQSDWTKELVWEWDGKHLRINTVAQWGCFHYNIKTWNPNE
jgi:hypothetical protein